MIEITTDETATGTAPSTIMAADAIKSTTRRRGAEIVTTAGMVATPEAQPCRPLTGTETSIDAAMTETTTGGPLSERAITLRSVDATMRRATTTEAVDATRSPRAPLVNPTRVIVDAMVAAVATLEVVDREEVVVDSVAGLRRVATQTEATEVVEEKEVASEVVGEAAIEEALVVEVVEAVGRSP